GNIPHTNTLWGDMKVFGHFAYVVNDNGGGGIDVVDLSDVDNGNVTLVQQVTDGGLSTSHDVAIDTDSGFLYLCGANLNGGRLIAYDLSNPADPTFAGQVSSSQGVNVHDVQVVTYTSGPYAGKQIAFACSGGTGLDIFDVTNKLNMFRLSRTTYPNLSFAHQGWLSEDRSYFYLNDELDGVNETVVFDVTDLENPMVVNTYSSGVPAIDHNLYVHDGFIYEAEYTAGLRIFCADDPVNPVQVGWFDTYPENDDSGFDGAWSNFPFFPSGTVIVSDMNRGLFILNVTEALNAGSLTFAYPNGRPDFIDPAGGTTVRVEVAGSCGAAPQPGTGLLHYDAGGGFVAVPMEPIAENVYDAVFPGIICPSAVSYYISVQTSAGSIKTDPPGAPDITYSTTATDGVVVVLQDNFENDQGWTTENLGATSGQWQRGVPVNDPDWAFAPAEDGDGSGQCWLTQNEFGNTDVDDGAVRLTSALLDMTVNNIVLGYEYFLRLTNEDGNDRLLVEISSNGDAGPWTVVATHDTNGGLSWRHHEITQAELEAAGVTLTSNMKIRYTANDADAQSIVEAGVDGLTITSLQCEGSCDADLSGDGSVGPFDLAQLLGAWGPNPGHPADFDGDGNVGPFDLAVLLGSWGPCP
ncbi:MAG: choice-of-anchor B family protein, partial [Phycisphaeraceae bacterium]